MRSVRRPPFLGIPSAVPGGRAVRAITVTLGVALALTATVAETWAPVIATHASAHASECIDVPVAVHGSGSWCGPPGVSVLISMPARAPDDPSEVLIRGESYSQVDLGRYLHAMADTRRESEAPDSPSAVEVVLRADRHLPWQRVEPVLAACRSARIYRISFVVRPRDLRACAFERPGTSSDPITTPLKEQLR